MNLFTLICMAFAYVASITIFIRRPNLFTALILVAVCVVTTGVIL